MLKKYYAYDEYWYAGWVLKINKRMVIMKFKSTLDHYEWPRDKAIQNI